MDMFFALLTVTMLLVLMLRLLSYESYNTTANTMLTPVIVPSDSSTLALPATCVQKQFQWLMILHESCSGCFALFGIAGTDGHDDGDRTSKVFF